jgi:hypothetical protein
MADPEKDHASSDTGKPATSPNGRPMKKNRTEDESESADEMALDTVTKNLFGANASSSAVDVDDVISIDDDGPNNDGTDDLAEDTEATKEVNETKPGTATLKNDKQNKNNNKNDNKNPTPKMDLVAAKNIVTTPTERPNDLQKKDFTFDFQASGTYQPGEFHQDYYEWIHWQGTQQDYYDWISHQKSDKQCVKLLILQLFNTAWDMWEDWVGINRQMVDFTIEEPSILFRFNPFLGILNFCVLRPRNLLAWSS